MGPTDTDSIRDLSREIIEYLIAHPNISKDKITNIKGYYI